MQTKMGLSELFTRPFLYCCLVQLYIRMVMAQSLQYPMDSMYEKIGSPEPSTCAKVIRVFNIISAVLLVAFGVVGLVYMILHDVISARFFLIFSPVFIVLFGLVMIAVQFRVGFVMEAFDFLSTLLGKGIFYLYLSTDVFFFFSCQEGDTVLAWIASMIIFGLGIVFIILNYCGGDYNEQVRERLS